MKRNIYNPGDYKFKNYIKYNKYFVDKTNLIMELNKNINSNKNYFCVTLPSNFGKTVIVNMLVAYYSFTESKITVFDDKKISKNKGWDKYLGKYNVIKLDVEDIFEDSNIKDGIKEIKKIIINEVKIFYQNFECDEKEGIKEIIKKIYKSTHRKIILIIDEWDLVLRNESRDTKSKNDYLKFLNKLIKNDENIVLTYMTGILPIRNYNLNSKFDIDFVEFSMITPGWMAKYIGFNKDEVNQLCKTHLANNEQKFNNKSNIKVGKKKKISKKLSHKNDNEKVDDEVLYKAIDDFYNGYQLKDESSNIKYEIYSPYSVIEAIKEKHVKNYQMINKNFLHEFVQNNFQNLKYVISLLIKQKSINIDTLKFQNDEISFEKRKSNLFLLVHYGYLGYNSSKNEIFIPNKEILELFKILIKSEIWKNLNKSSEIFNPGEYNYSKFFENDYVVDKTELILNINKNIGVNDKKNICVTRPRRFGKTVTVNMLVAYYSFTESKITVFDDKKISKNKGWDKYLGKYNVIKLDVEDIFEDSNIKDGIKEIKKIIINEVKIFYQNFECDEKEGIKEIIKKIYKSTHRKIILIIDEWDLVLRNESRDTKSKNDYLKFLNKLIKNDENIVLTYMTGILPIRNYNLNSKFDIDFVEFSMITPGWMAKYIGFNKDEVNQLCKTHLANKMFNLSNKKQRLNNGSFIKIDKNEQISEKLSHKNDNEKVDDEVLYKAIDDFYNGYQLIDKYSDIKYEIYSPYSVIEAMKEEHIKNYQMINKNFLHEFVQNNFQNLKYVISLLIKQKSINIDTLKFQNDEISFEKRKSNLFLLVHYGYLGYNSSKNEIFIPNKEILELFKILIESEIWKNLNKSSEIFNPGEYNYSKFFENDYVVDKTELILNINKNIGVNDKKNICVTSPRRFGKTVTVNMLVAYYSFTESKITVFDDKKISKTKGWDKYLGKYNVILLNNQKYFLKKTVTKGIKEIKKSIIENVKMYDKHFKCDKNEDIDEIIKKIYESTNRKIVLIIDEWDLVIRNESRDTKSKNDYFEFLTLLIKNDENIVLTYMTGILPIRNYNLNSKFDIDFVEFSMITPGWMAKYIGFNKDEVNQLCKTHLANKMFNLSNKKQRLNNGSFIKIDKNEQISEKLSHKNDNEKVDDEVLYKAIDDFYNGYQLIDKYSDIKYEIYSPYSVIEAMKEEHIKNYQMINKNFLHEFVQNNFQNLKYVISLLIKQKSINIDTLKFQNDEISFEKRKSNLFLLVHYGYLGYNSSKNEIFIPNKEILELFKILIESEIWKNLNKSSEIFNPGEYNYSKFFENDYVVDKTELILNINKNIGVNDKKNICVTRPRRFGKTVTVNMLVAYYSFTESKITVFDDKKISKNKGWDKYLGKYNVILLNNLNYFLGKTVIEGIEIIKKSIIEDVKMYNKHFKCDENEDINEIIKKIYNSTKRKIVLIIDEWDIIFRDPKKDESSKIEYIEFLTPLIKGSNYIILTYMTGILPLKGYGINSSLKGVFDEFTMVSDNNFAKYVGFTEDDIKVLCEKYLSEKILENPYKIQSCNHKKENKNKNIIETNREMIKEWYNGYRLKDKNDRKEYDIYTPYSVIKAIENKKIDNYWINTETFSDLVDYIKFEIKELKENVVILMNKNELKIDINKYESNVNNVEYTNKDEVLTILVHLGYLAYDNEKGKIRIPNEEINKVFGEATKKVNYSAVFKIINDSKRLLEATWNKKAEKVAKSLENSHDQYSNKVYNTESTLQSTILNAYIFANAYYTLIPEADTGKGYADIIFIPFNKDKPAMVVELKYNSTTNTGIEQIKNRNYPARLEHYINNLLLICINYDNTAKSNSENFKHHTCIIEKYDKNKN